MFVAGRELATFWLESWWCAPKYALSAVLVQEILEYVYRFYCCSTSQTCSSATELTGDVLGGVTWEMWMSWLHEASTPTVTKETKKPH